MSRVNKTVFILVAIVALILGLTVQKVLNQRHQLDPTVLLDAGIVILPQTRSVPDLAFTDQDGQPFQTASLKDKWSLLVFGDTLCPAEVPAPLPASGRPPQCAEKMLTAEATARESAWALATRARACTLA